MARASFIYVVNQGTCPIAAFTVKHELMSFLEDHGFPLWIVYRIKDGATELLATDARLFWLGEHPV